VEAVQQTTTAGKPDQTIVRAEQTDTNFHKAFGSDTPLISKHQHMTNNAVAYVQVHN
jgi:hypothetical protein